MASPPSSSSLRVYKEGILLKRARGLRNKRNIKWQERYCRLTEVSLDYYDPKKLVRKKETGEREREDECSAVHLYKVYIYIHTL